MTEYVKRYFSAGAPETIMHEEYEGRLDSTALMERLERFRMEED